MLRCRNTQGNVEMHRNIWKCKEVAACRALPYQRYMISILRKVAGDILFLVHDLYLILCLRDKMIAAFSVLSELQTR